MQSSRRIPLDLAHPGRVLIITAILALAVDQVAKVVVRGSMQLQESIQLIPHVIHLTYVRNVGAAFGLFPGRQPVFILTSLVVLFVIAAFWRRAHPTQWPVVIALGLVSAGAIGNLIDRITIGYVTDFLEFGFVSFPVFNVADMCILVGVGILMVWILFGPEQEADAGHAEHAEQTEQTSGAEDLGSLRSVDAEGATPHRRADDPLPADEVTRAHGGPS